jgi:uncharacterized protein (TIGR02118 family)
VRIRLELSNSFSVYLQVLKERKRIMQRKTNLLWVVFACIGFISCKTSQSNQSTPQTGMYKVTILYPNGEDKTFDMDYYEKKHMPMVAGFLGKNLKFYEIDKGIAGRTPNDKLPFLAVGYFYIIDIAEYNKAIAQNRDAITSDFKNYTNIQPVVQISEIKQLVHNNTN